MIVNNNTGFDSYSAAQDLNLAIRGHLGRLAPGLRRVGPGRLLLRARVHAPGAEQGAAAEMGVYLVP